MKKGFFKIITLALLLLAAAALSGCAIVRMVGNEVRETMLRGTPAPTSAPQETEPSVTAEPTPSPAPTAEPEPTDTPRPTPNDAELSLVNFDYPCEREAQVVLLKPFLTADNVTCDERRHGESHAAIALNDMFLAAQEEGDFHFIIASAFRSLYEQEVLWAPRVAAEPNYGSDPYASPVCVMPPRCSEHITGLAFDILSDSCPHSDVIFAKSAEGLWLAANAHRFGFILRFPEDKQNITGVEYEPWHFRYVGVDAARYMYENNLCLEEYLGCVHE